MRSILMKSLTMACLAVGFSGSLSQAQGEWRKDGRDAWHERINEKLNLTPEQKTKFKEIKNQMHTEMKALRSQKKDLRQKLQAAFEANQGAITEAANAMKASITSALQGVQLP